MAYFAFDLVQGLFIYSIRRKPGSGLEKIRNIFIVFLVSGFWHGANWTFLIWGFLNALFVTPSILFKTNRRNLDTVSQGRSLPNFKEVLAIGTTFGLTVFGWIFFRADSVSRAFNYLSEIFSSSFLTIPNFRGMRNGLITLFLVVLFVLVEWTGREQQFAIEKTAQNWKRPFRFALYYTMILVIFWFSGKEQHFIYFQF